MRRQGTQAGLQRGCEKRGGDAFPHHIGHYDQQPPIGTEEDVVIVAGHSVGRARGEGDVVVVTGSIGLPVAPVIVDRLA